MPDASAFSLAACYTSFGCCRIMLISISIFQFNMFKLPRRSTQVFLAKPITATTSRRQALFDFPRTCLHSHSHEQPHATFKKVFHTRARVVLLLIQTSGHNSALSLFPCVLLTAQQQMEIIITTIAENNVHMKRQTTNNIHITASFVAGYNNRPPSLACLAGSAFCELVWAWQVAEAGNNSAMLHVFIFYGLRWQQW